MFADVPFYPERASTFAEEMDPLFFFILGVTAFFSVLIAVLITTFAIRYRRRSDSDRPRPVTYSGWVETAWIVVPLIIVLIIFFWSSRVYFSWARAPENSIEVYVVGQQWMWKMQHLGGQREINQLHVPVNRPVKLTMTSQDVIHSFFVPAFRVHMDVVPGRYTTVWFQATKPGRYHLFCSQYCGTNHAKMIGEVIVLDQEEYQTWLNQKVDGSMATEGRKLFQKLQCVSCHSADAQARAPVLEDLYGKQVALQGGGTVLANETYLRRSILNPDADIVAGYQPIMPSYEGQVNEEEILQLITFIKALGPGQTPLRNERAEPPALNPTLLKKQGQRP